MRVQLDGIALRHRLAGALHLKLDRRAIVKGAHRTEERILSGDVLAIERQQQIAHPHAGRICEARLRDVADAILRVDGHAKGLRDTREMSVMRLMS